MSERKPDPSKAYADFKRLQEDNKISKAPPPPPKLPGSYVPDPKVISRVEAMSDPEKADMRIEIERKRKPTLTAVYRRLKPDAKHWTLEDHWELPDAALLRVDLEPREGLGFRLKELLERDDVADILHTLLKRDELTLLRHVQDILRRARGPNSTLPKQEVTMYEDITGHRSLWITKPADFASWSLTRSPVDVPEWMRALAGETEQDRLDRELAEARAEIAALRGQLAVEPALPAGYVADTLEKVRAARDDQMGKHGKAPRKSVAAAAGVAESTAQKYLDYLKTIDR